MSAFIILAADFFVYGIISPFILYFILSWSIYLLKLYRSSLYRPYYKKRNHPYPSVSIIIPVYNEPQKVWAKTLRQIRKACEGLTHEIVVVPNGDKAEANALYAEQEGFRVFRMPNPGKREAIAKGAAEAHHEISVILDSDTILLKESLKRVLVVFADPTIGGVTPHHKIFNRKPLMRRMSDWLEDNRFNEVVKGQSVDGAVSCLPGRLFALRTAALKKAAPYLVSQTFLGMQCISGDDRFLTSWLLKHGFKTVFQSRSVVYTEAPSDLKGFVKQRLRWSRGSLRGTIKALPWLWKYPYTMLTVLRNVVMRWFLFFILVDAFLLHLTDDIEKHWVWQEYPSLDHFYVIIPVLVGGFFLGGFLRRLRHLIHFPQDLPYYIPFVSLSILVLTPLEWYGNLTCWKQGWLTRGLGSQFVNPFGGFAKAWKRARGLEPVIVREV